MSLLQDAERWDLLDLIEPNSREFAFPGWPDQLSRQRYFRVIGLSYVLDHLGVSHAAVFGNLGYTASAIASVPATWKQAYPATEVDWKTFKRDQFSYAHHSAPIKLNKACIAILMACAALEKRGMNYQEVFSYVKICPQTFFIDGFDSYFYDSYVRNMPMQEDLLRISGQASSTFLN